VIHDVARAGAGGPACRWAGSLGWSRTSDRRSGRYLL
jgi:hypothetical protein